MRSCPTVFLDRLQGEYGGLIRQGLERVGFFERTPRGSAVFLKPNLTFPEFRPGVMTSYECLAAVTETLVEKGYRVTIGEADSGGYNRFSMDEVFERMGIYKLAERTGARVVNISFTEPEVIRLHAGWKQIPVPLPKMLLGEMDAFITLPVPKIHMNTLVSMSLKNQWGCIQDPAERLKLHPYFSRVIYEIASRLPPAYSIIDGRYGLNRSGPMLGEVVSLDWLLVSDDLVAADRVCCRLMGIDETRVAHLNYFKKQGWWTGFEKIRINQELGPFWKQQFYLKRAWTDLPGLACFCNSFLAWIGYRSPLAGFLHWLLYLFRKPFYNYETEKQRVRNNP